MHAINKPPLTPVANHFIDQITLEPVIAKLYLVTQITTNKELAREAVLCQMITNFEVLNSGQIDLANLNYAGFLSMPDNLQEAIVVLIMSKKETHDLFISLGDVIGALADLRGHPESTAEIKQAISDYLDHGDLDLFLLTNGVRNYNQKQNDQRNCITVEADLIISTWIVCHLNVFLSGATDVNGPDGALIPLPDDFQKAIVRLMMSTKKGSDLSISPKNTELTLRRLKDHPKSTEKTKEAITNYEKFADLSLLLTNGVQLYNQNNPDKPVWLKTNVLGKFPDDVHPLRNPHFLFKDQLSLSGTCLHLYKMHEKILEERLTPEGKSARTERLIKTAKKQFRKHPEHRLFAWRAVDPVGLRYQKEVHEFDFGPNTLWKIKNQELTQKEA